jgi:SAM-dependent methyltransferase
MGKYQKSEYYDKLYTESVVYNYADVQRSPYYEAWKKVIRFCSKNKKIADFGCGNGLFAKLCLMNDRQYAVGYDFSQVAIEKAKATNPTIADRFILHDLTDPEIYKTGNFEIAVFVEVIEHLENDLDVLSHLPEFMPTIITVPNYDSRSHVRFFKDINETINRYRELFFIKETITCKTKADDKNEIYLLVCEKKWDLM